MESSILSLKNAAIFQNETLVFSEVNVSINQGELVYLIGKTGSGKSSFIKTLYADLPLNTGSGHVVGHNLKTLKKKEIPFLRRKLGIVFQDFKLLPDRSVIDNFLFVLKATAWKDKAAMKTKIYQLLEKVGMQDKGAKLPHQLSGGEQQRIAIARALLNDPQLILADEPTGNLDPQTSLEVMNLLKDIHKNGRTILMATHDYSLILKYPSKILKCDDGKVYEVVQKSNIVNN